MLNRRNQYIAASVLTVIVAAVFYFFVLEPFLNPETEVLVVEETNEVVEPVAYDSLTGVGMDEEREVTPAIVMFDNFATVSAQAGLEEASIVYEALAEGGITRLMGIFDSSKDIKRVGPVRSVRPYFIDWAREYGGFLMHVGGSPDALSYLDRIDELLDIDQIGANEKLFYRDESIDPPHNVFTSASSWRQINERFDVPEESITSWQYSHTSTPPENPLTQQLEIEYFPDNEVAWVYNEELNNYLRFVNAERHKYTTGEQVSAVNIVVIEVPARVIDSIGRLDVDTIGSGQGFILSNGKRTEIQWEKKRVTSRLTFTTESGEQGELIPGVTWVTVVPDLDQVTYSEFESD